MKEIFNLRWTSPFKEDIIKHDTFISDCKSQRLLSDIDLQSFELNFALEFKEIPDDKFSFDIIVFIKHRDDDYSKQSKRIQHELCNYLENLISERIQFIEDIQELDEDQCSRNGLFRQIMRQIGVINNYETNEKELRNYKNQNKERLDVKNDVNLDMSCEIEDSVRHCICKECKKDIEIEGHCRAHIFHKKPIFSEENDK